MISNTGSKIYRLNLIRELREREVKKERRRRLTVILSMGCFGFFILSLLYSGLTIWQMERVLNIEAEKVTRLKQEYQKYATSRLIVDKNDIELLSGLQEKGVLWTKKIAAMAKHLPENYWITKFSYSGNELSVSGYGFANSRQDQLLVLNDYLNRLRNDTTFSGTFKRVQLTIAERKDDAAGHVAFGFSAYTQAWKAQ